MTDFSLIPMQYLASVALAISCVLCSIFIVGYVKKHNRQDSTLIVAPGGLFIGSIYFGVMGLTLNPGWFWVTPHYKLGFWYVFAPAIFIQCVFLFGAVISASGALRYENGNLIVITDTLLGRYLGPIAKKAGNVCAMSWVMVALMFVAPLVMAIAAVFSFIIAMIVSLFSLQNPFTYMRECMRFKGWPSYEQRYFKRPVRPDSWLGDFMGSTETSPEYIPMSPGLLLVICLVFFLVGLLLFWAWLGIHWLFTYGGIGRVVTYTAGLIFVCVLYGRIAHHLSLKYGTADANVATQILYDTYTQRRLTPEDIFAAKIRRYPIIAPLRVAWLLFQAFYHGHCPGVVVEGSNVAADDDDDDCDD